MFQLVKKVIRVLLALVAFFFVAILVMVLIDEAQTPGEYASFGFMTVVFLFMGLLLLPFGDGNQEQSPSGEAEFKPKDQAPMPSGYTPTAGTGGYADPHGYAQQWAAPSAGEAPYASQPEAAGYGHPSGVNPGGVAGAGMGADGAASGASGSTGAGAAAGGASGAGPGTGEDIVIDYAAFQEDEASADAASSDAVRGAPSASLSALGEASGSESTGSAGGESEAGSGTGEGGEEPPEDSRAAYERRIHESMSPVANLSPDDFLPSDAATSAGGGQAGASGTGERADAGPGDHAVPGIAELFLADAPQLRQAAASGEWVNVQLVRKAAGLGKDPNLVVLLGWSPLATIEPNTKEYAALIDFAGKGGSLQVREESGALRGTLSMGN